MSGPRLNAGHHYSWFFHNPEVLDVPSQNFLIK